MFGTGERILRKGDYIWGAFMRSSQLDGYIVAMNPGERSDVLGRFGFSATAVDDAVGAAREGFATWSHMPVEARVQAMNAYADLLEEETDLLAVLITRETGKPLWEATEEVILASRGVRLLARSTASMTEPVVLRKDTAWSSPTPHGVVGVICPASFPLLMPSLFVASSLLTGNAVVFKPSKFAPAVGQAVAERMDRIKLPRGAFNMVQGSGAVVGRRLVTHPGIDALLFAGSYQAACAIQAQTSGRPELPVFYNCGGKGAGIVTSSANLDRAAYDLAVSAFLSTGQRHDNCARTFIVKEHFDAFCEKVTELGQHLKVGYGFDEDIFMGPMSSDIARKGYFDQVRALRSEGHMPILEAGPAHVPGHKGFYARPAMHWVQGAAKLVDEPVGPNMLVYCVDDWEEAVELHEKMAFRRCVAVYGDAAGSQTRELISRLTTGYVSVNRGTVGSPLQLAAAGRGRASRGVPPGLDLLRFLVVPRSVYIDNRPFDGSRSVPGLQGPLMAEEAQEEEVTAPT